MYWVETIIFLLSAVGIIFVCDFRLDDINALLSRPHKSTLKSDIAILIGKPQTGLRRQYSALEQQLAAAGHGDKVAAVTRISIILFAVGTVILLLCNNVYLIPNLTKERKELNIEKKQSIRFRYRQPCPCRYSRFYRRPSGFAYGHR